MLAIIIPYYKLTFLEETLRSLSNQTDKRFKVYIGDDASPENPLQLLKQFEGRFEFVYHRFEDNLGGVSLTKQWERCVNLSKDEEWVMILGDDDFIDEKLVELWYCNFESFNKKAAVIRFASKLIYEKKNVISEIYSHPIWENATDSFYRKFEHLTRSSLSEYVFLRESFLKFGFYDYPLAWNSDDRAWLDFSNQKPIYTINDCVVFVRLSVLNISGKQDNNEAKNLSVISFYRFLISKKLQFYTFSQREKILRFYENEINKQRNLTQSEWFFLWYFYLKYFKFYLIKKFSIRFLKAILKRQ